eukprot:361448-Chlamydomonas_euryale.AAC.1
MPCLPPECESQFWGLPRSPLHPTSRPPLNLHTRSTREQGVWCMPLVVSLSRLSASGRLRRPAPNRNTSCTSVNSFPQLLAAGGCGAAPGGSGDVARPQSTGSMQALQERFARSWGSSHDLAALAGGGALAGSGAPSSPAMASSMSTPSEPERSASSIAMPPPGPPQSHATSNSGTPWPLKVAASGGSGSALQATSPSGSVGF